MSLFKIYLTILLFITLSEAFFWDNTPKGDKLDHPDSSLKYNEKQEKDISLLMNKALTLTENGKRVLAEGEHARAELLKRHGSCFPEVIAKFDTVCDTQSWSEDDKTLYATMLTLCHVTVAGWESTKACDPKPTTESGWEKCRKSMQSKSEIANAYTSFRNTAEMSCFVHLYPQYQTLANEATQKIIQNGIDVTNRLASLASDVLQFRQNNERYLERLISRQDETLKTMAGLKNIVADVAAGMDIANQELKTVRGKVTDIKTDTNQVKGNMVSVLKNVNVIQKDTEITKDNVAEVKRDAIELKDIIEKSWHKMEKFITLADRIYLVTETPIALYDGTSKILWQRFLDIKETARSYFLACISVLFCIVIWWYFLDWFLKIVSIGFWISISYVVDWIDIMDLHTVISITFFFAIFYQLYLFIYGRGDDCIYNVDDECPDDWEEQMFSYQLYNQRKSNDDI